MSRLRRSFYERYTPTVARDLLGCRLVRVMHGKRLSGIIVETEAYRGARDPASHAYKGRTARNSVMFGEAGHAYIYFTYGFHHCLNLTTEPAGNPGAVLIRGIEPTEGAEEMVRNRGKTIQEHVADGPGRLTQALRIDRSLNDEDLVTSKRLFLEEGKRDGEVGKSSRVGINRGTGRKWRFFLRGNESVSRARPSLAEAQNP